MAASKREDASFLNIKRLHPQPTLGLSAMKHRAIPFRKALQAFLLLMLMAPGYGEATSYTFTEIAGPSAFHSVDSPAINANGTVAFTAGLNPLGDQGVFTGNGGPLITIATSNLNFLNFAGPSINDAGTVAFKATLHPSLGSTTYGIFTGNGGSLTTVINIDSNTGSVGIPSINNAATVAFPKDSSSSFSGIVTSSGGVLTTIADNSVISSRGFGDAPSINNLGTVSFQEFFLEIQMP